MRIIVNGEDQKVASGFRLHDLLARLDKSPSQVAVEHNGEIVDRCRFATLALRENDRLEILHFVGGG